MNRSEKGRISIENVYASSRSTSLNKQQILKGPKWHQNKKICSLGIAISRYITILIRIGTSCFGTLGKPTKPKNSSGSKPSEKWLMSKHSTIQP